MAYRPSSPCRASGSGNWLPPRFSNGAKTMDGQPRSLQIQRTSCLRSWSLAAYAAREQLGDVYVLFACGALRACDQHPVSSRSAANADQPTVRHRLKQDRRVGSVSSGDRTPEQTLKSEVFAGVNTAIGFQHVWNIVAGTLAQSQDLSLIDTARERAHRKCPPDSSAPGEAGQWPCVEL